MVIVGASDVLLLALDPKRREYIIRTLQAANAVVTVSRQLMSRTVDLGVPATRVHVWQQGVDDGIFHPGNQHDARIRLNLKGDDPLILWVGRMVPVKGLDILLDACFAMTKVAGLRFRLCLIGEGPLKQKLRHQVRKLKLDRYVEFAGHYPPARLGDWYRAADVTVLPSQSEGLPNVLLESRPAARLLSPAMWGEFPKSPRRMTRWFPPTIRPNWPKPWPPRFAVARQARRRNFQPGWMPPTPWWKSSARRRPSRLAPAVFPDIVRSMLPLISIPQSSLKLSAMCMGNAAFGTGLPETQTDRLYAAFREAGGNCFDSAHCYCFWLPGGQGCSERALGKCIHRHGDVGQVSVITKGGHPAAPPAYPRPDAYLSPEILGEDIDDSLDDLNGNGIDLYILHRDDTRVPVSEIIDCLNTHIAAGRIGAIGQVQLVDCPHRASQRLCRQENTARLCRLAAAIQSRPAECPRSHHRPRHALFNRD